MTNTNTATRPSKPEPGRGPGPKALTDDALSQLLARHMFGVLAINKRSGHPNLSTIAYAWDPEERVIRISTTADRAKVRILRRDPRAALHVSSPDHLSFVVAEGEVEVSPVSEVPGDEIGRELLSIVGGFADPEEEAVFLRNMVADQRLVLRLRVNRLYGTALADAS